jgi:hypothetical protein
LGRRTPGFWLVVLGGCMVGATLGRAAAAAVSNGAAVLRLSAVIALATVARLGFAASRAWCSAITWAALVPLSMACQRCSCSRIRTAPSIRIPWRSYCY